MCGIWAIMARDKHGLFSKDVDLAVKMMILSSLRGMHSTGLSVTNYRKPWQKPRVWKTIGGPDFLIQSEVWKDISEYIAKEGGVVFGHGRYATKGSITAKNAHPFSHKNITLVHNGTITDGLADNTSEVDSHALCVDMAEKGVLETLQKVSGAFAIIAHDMSNNCIWIAKNIQRPLHFSDSFDRTYFMSEEDALRYVLPAASKVSALMSNKLFKFDLENFKITEEGDIPPKYDYGTYYGGAVFNGHRREPEPSTFDRKIYTTDNKPIKFTVDTIKKENDKEFIYSATSETNQLVEFRTNEELPELIGRVGSAPLKYEIWKSGKKFLFVRYRTITWETDEPEVDDSLVTTATGEKISRKKWEHVCKTEVCGVCSGRIFEFEAKDTYVSPTSTICKNCVDEYMEMKRTGAFQ